MIICICMIMYVCIYIYIYIFKYICVYVYIYIYVCNVLIVGIDKIACKLCPLFITMLIQKRTYKLTRPWSRKHESRKYKNGRSAFCLSIIHLSLYYTYIYIYIYICTYM